MYFSARRGGVTSFDPLSLSPALWLSDTGSDPSVWPDLSGNGRNATQATTANQPAIVMGAQNGRQVRRFDGGDMLSGSRILSSANFSCLVVMRGSPQLSRMILAQRSLPAVNSGRLELISTDELAPGQVHRVFLNNGTGYNVKATTVSLNNTFRTVYSQNDSTATMHCRVDGGGPEGSISGQSLTPENVPYSVGGGVDLTRTFTGDIAEILVFPYALSTTDRQAVETYLFDKWGLTFWNDSASWDDAANWTD